MIKRAGGMLSGDAVRWVVDFVQIHSDGDLFPKVIEMNAISDHKDQFVALIEGKDLSQFSPGACMNISFCESHCVGEIEP
ncbi:hypothetical protein UF75_3231 [Desulfosporosinus sp. I2]|uniref:hypothetical protein n=1 Tax=Desulfosporosinus sp. I2 TaxID=1617025 RepID=UPI00061FB338|nr:hypothetical protein [Desulfosporosinus sp. I2]KJR46364.1 hypothetical protein UF75_3231 [Desulfosporosinus sp. I2]